MGTVASDHVINETPIAVVDIETTGLQAGGDKIVEVAVVRLEPNGEPEVVLDTLVNPMRPVAATEIHGITDQDVADAPTFAEVAGALVTSMRSAIMASYNVYFDARFLAAELRQSGVRSLPPHLCLMYMRPLLDLGAKCTLDDACRAHGIHHGVAHRAAEDALASARLWPIYAKVFSTRGLRTFGDLTRVRSYKFMQSFGLPLVDTDGASVRQTGRLRPRGRAAAPATSAAAPAISAATANTRAAELGEYWNALKGAVADHKLDDEEIRYLSRKRVELGLTPDEIRWLHGRAFGAILSDFAQDRAISDDEAEALWRVGTGLRRIGWAPGDPLGSRADALVGAPARQRRRGFLGWIRR
jgi:DNA polymerase III epsilon subunit-like protein